MVVVGVDEDHLHAQFFEPEAADRALEGRIDAAPRAFGVGRPEHDHLRVPERVLEQVVLLGDPQPVAVSPHVHAAPVPALPAVGVVGGLHQTHQVRETLIGAVAVADVPPEMVGAAGGEHGAGPVGALDPVDLAADDVEGFIPADRFIARFAALLAVALAVRVEVDPLERSEHALWRVDHRLVTGGVRHDRGPPRRRERPSSRLDRPGLTVRIVEVHGRDPQDLSVLDVDEDRPSRRAVGKSLHFAHAFDLRWRFDPRATLIQCPRITMIQSAGKWNRLRLGRQRLQRALHLDLRSHLVVYHYEFVHVLARTLDPLPADQGRAVDVLDRVHGALGDR